MARLTWDKDVGHNGLDKGVLYLSDGSGVAWNGLVNVKNATNVANLVPRYFDGERYLAETVEPDSESSISAFTYPVEFEVYAGFGGGLPGLSSTGWRRKQFSLSYRTRVIDEDGLVSYQTHILYNLLAILTPYALETVDDSRDLTIFTWNILASPEELNGFAPSAYVMFDHRYLSGPDVTTLVDTLYGTDLVDPALPTMQTLVDSMTQIVITNNFDGTWTAEDDAGLYISMLNPEDFQITDVNAVFLDADTYDISST